MNSHRSTSSRVIAGRCLSGLFCVLCVGLAGCEYKGTSFQHSSGSLPFLGFQMAVGGKAADAEVTHANAAASSVRKSGRTRSPLPSLWRNLTSPRKVSLPPGTERVVESDDYEAELNSF